MKFLIEIEDKSNTLVEDLMKTKNPSLGSIHKIDDNHDLIYEDRTINKGFFDGDTSALLEFSIAVLGNIGISVFTNYLYDCIKNRSVKLWINDEAVKIEDIESIMRKILAENSTINNKEDSENNSPNTAPPPTG